jgi:hypothetical protein
MIQALINGETDPAKLAALAHWKVRASAATPASATINSRRRMWIAM